MRPPSIRDKMLRDLHGAMLAADAHTCHVQIYNTMTSGQQFTLTALAFGYIPTQISNVLNLSLLTIDRHIAVMERLFKEPNLSGLMQLARSLLTERETTS